LFTRNELKAPVILKVKKEAETWMFNVLMGRMAVAHLVSELETVLPSHDVERLYGCVKNNSLHYRNRALGRVESFEGHQEDDHPGVF